MAVIRLSIAEITAIRRPQIRELARRRGQRLHGPFDAVVVDVVVGDEADDTGRDRAGQDALAAQVVAELVGLGMRKREDVGRDALRIDAGVGPALGDCVRQPSSVTVARP